MPTGDDSDDVHSADSVVLVVPDERVPLPLFLGLLHVGSTEPLLDFHQKHSVHVSGSSKQAAGHISHDPRQDQSADRRREQNALEVDGPGLLGLEVDDAPAQVERADPHDHLRVSAALRELFCADHIQGVKGVQRQGAALQVSVVHVDGVVARDQEEEEEKDDSNQHPGPDAITRLIYKVLGGLGPGHEAVAPDDRVALDLAGFRGADRPLHAAQVELPETLGHQHVQLRVGHVGHDPLRTRTRKVGPDAPEKVFFGRDAGRVVLVEEPHQHDLIEAVETATVGKLEVNFPGICSEGNDIILRPELKRVARGGEHFGVIQDSGSRRERGFFQVDWVHGHAHGVSIEGDRDEFLTNGGVEDGCHRQRLLQKKPQDQACLKEPGLSSFVCFCSIRF